MRHERQQRPGADESDASADGDALRLQRDLRTAEAEDAGQRPAGEGQHAVHGAGREDEAIERQLAVALRREQVEAPAEHVPDERARAVVDRAARVAEDAVDRRGLLRLESVDRGRLVRAAGGRLAIDLSARSLSLVDDDRPQAGARQRFGATHARRSGADDDDGRLSQGDLRR